MNKQGVRSGLVSKVQRGDILSAQELVALRTLRPAAPKERREPRHETNRPTAIEEAQNYRQRVLREQTLPIDPKAEPMQLFDPEPSRFDEELLGHYKSYAKQSYVWTRYKLTMVL